jgi:hypothetical protein
MISDTNFGVEAGLCMRLIAAVVLGKYEAKTAFIEEAE